jgi:NitT/TauT family transport system permease protein
MTAEPPDGVERIPPPWDPGSEALEDPGAIEAALDVEGGADELAKASTSGAEAVVGRWTSPLGRLARTTLAILAFVFIVAIVWEAFKWLFGDPWRLTDILGTGLAYEHEPPFSLKQASDVQLPHLWEIARALSEPVQRNSETTLLGHLVGASLYTWQEAIIGFLIGSVIGILLATLFVHSRFAERAFTPYVVASQAVPIVVIAPILVVAFGQGLTSVVIVTTYLTFFPVTISEMRGLRAPDPRTFELMRSYAASRWDIWRKLRLPASVPYLFTALKIAAVASIVGAIIGEGPGGIQAGLGRAIIVFFQAYVTSPEKLWATIFAASLTGIAFFMLVRLAEVAFVRRRGQREVQA